jgi:hypothetical protein
MKEKALFFVVVELLVFQVIISMPITLCLHKQFNFDIALPDADGPQRLKFHLFSRWVKISVKNPICFWISKIFYRHQPGQFSGFNKWHKIGNGQCTKNQRTGVEIPFGLFLF